MITNAAPAVRNGPERWDRETRAHVTNLVTGSGTSFLWGMRVLPRHKRRAMFAIYAFCREVDDIADDPFPVAEKRRRLAEWRQEIERLYEGHPRVPTARALAGPVRDYGLEKEDFLALLDGMEMDAAEIRAPSLAELELYCDRVACAVGRLSIRAFGATTPPARDVALHLGQALQLTNILRDLKEDARRGRLYLPRELLEAHGITLRDPERVLDHPGLGAVCDELAAMAERRFEAAAEALRTCPRRHMRPATVMMQIYRRTLERLRRRGWHALDRPVRLSGAEKAWIALCHGIV